MINNYVIVLLGSILVPLAITQVDATQYFRVAQILLSALVAFEILRRIIEQKYIKLYLVRIDRLCLVYIQEN